MFFLDIPVSVKLEGSNYAAEGSKYTITCTGTGYPVPTSVTWNVDKSDTTRYTISGKKDVSYAVLSWIETLVVNSFIDTDAKTYVCTSTNVANGVSNTAQAKLMVSKCKINVKHLQSCVSTSSLMFSFNVWGISI